MIEIATILYGSQNYGLDSPDSDRDYKVLLCPQFDDFYEYRKVEKTDVPAKYDKEHYSPMSVMQFHSLLRKGNPNCLEMLYSREQNYSNGDFLVYMSYMYNLYDHGYIALVWEQFYAALRGLAMNAVDRYGITPKTISRAWYFYSLMQWIMDDQFRVTGATWRKSAPTTAARKIRFGGVSDPLEDFFQDVEDGFAFYKELSAKKAAQFVADNAPRFDALKNTAAQADYLVRDLVATVLRTDIEKALTNIIV